VSEKPRVVGIIQARMTSTRFPGKVLAEVAGHPVLWHVVHRARQVGFLDAVIVATTREASDDPLADFCEKEGIPCFRGSEDDVLDRYFQVAKEIGARVIVRITADCPLIDPGGIDRVIEVFLEGCYDYVCNTLPPTFPDGLDIEVFTFEGVGACLA